MGLSSRRSLINSSELVLPSDFDAPKAQAVPVALPNPGTAVGVAQAKPGSATGVAKVFGGATSSRFFVVLFHCSHQSSLRALWAAPEVGPALPASAGQSQVKLFQHGRLVC
jgi:hypothetical protein